MILTERRKGQHRLPPGYVGMESATEITGLHRTTIQRRLGAGDVPEGARKFPQGWGFTVYGLRQWLGIPQEGGDPE